MGGAEAISGASRIGGISEKWGTTPQATEALYVMNRESPLSVEEAFHQADKFRAFGDNVVDYKVLPLGGVSVDHGGGLTINYRSLPDAIFDDVYGSTKNAGYQSPGKYYPNQKFTFDDGFGDEGVNIHIRESMFMSDRGSVSQFAHEYTEVQDVFDRAGQNAYVRSKWDEFIDAAHERTVPKVDNIIGTMIISGEM